MDRLLIALLFAFTALYEDIRAQDADWSGMVVYGQEKDKDKDKDKPVVPEPAQYGLFLVGASLAWCVVRRKKRITP